MLLFWSKMYMLLGHFCRICYTLYARYLRQIIIAFFSFSCVCLDAAFLLYWVYICCCSDGFCCLLLLLFMVVVYCCYCVIFCRCWWLLLLLLCILLCKHNVSLLYVSNTWDIPFFLYIFLYVFIMYVSVPTFLVCSIHWSVLFHTHTAPTSATHPPIQGGVRWSKVE